MEHSEAVIPELEAKRERRVAQSIDYLTGITAGFTITPILSATSVIQGGIIKGKTPSFKEFKCQTFQGIADMVPYRYIMPIIPQKSGEEVARRSNINNPVAKTLVAGMVSGAVATSISGALEKKMIREMYGVTKIPHMSFLLPTYVRNTILYTGLHANGEENQEAISTACAASYPIANQCVHSVAYQQTLSDKTIPSVKSVLKHATQRSTLPALAIRGLGTYAAQYMYNKTKPFFKKNLERVVGRESQSEQSSKERRL